MKKLFRIFVLLVPLTGLVLWGEDTYAAAACTSVATGNWSAQTTWSAAGTGCAGAPGGIPGAADSVTIADLTTVTVDVASAAASVSIPAGNQSSTLQLSSTLSVGGAITVYGPTGGGATKTLSVGAGTLNAASITINGGGGGGNPGVVSVSTGTINVSGSIGFAGTASDTLLTSTGASTINIGGDLGNGGTLTTTKTGTINFNGTVAAQNMGAYTTYNNVTVNNTNGAGVVTLLGNAAMTGALTVTSGTLSTSTFTLGVGGNFTVNGTVSGTGAITLSGTGTTIDGTGSVTNTATLTVSTGAKSVLSTANLTIASPIAISGAITVTNNGIITTTGITGSVPGSTWVNAANSTLNISGPLLATGTLTASANPNTVNYAGAAQTVTLPSGAPATYYHLTLSGSGVKTLPATAMTISGNFTMSGTATTTAAAALTVGGNFILGSGTTFTASTFNHSVAGNFTNNGTTFTANTSTITLNGAAAQVIGGTAATTFNNLTINNASGVTLGNSQTVSSTLTLTSGTFAVGAYTLTLNGPTIAGTPANLSTTSSSSLVFGGTSAGVLIPSSVGALNNLTINNANGVTLSGSPVLSGTLTLTSGIVTTGANILEITSSCSTGIVGASATTYVLGNLNLHYPTLNPGTTTCTFPIGTTGVYAPAAIAMVNVSSTLANSSLTARTDTPDHVDTTANASGVNPAKSVNRYWTLTAGGSLAFATYNTTFTFVAGDVDGGAATGSFIIGLKSSGVWSYPAMGAKNALNTTATGMTQAGGFGVFVIGERIMPSLTILKTVAVYSDPVNLLVNPKFIPGAVAQYAVISSNSGGPVDNNATVITDPVPANTLLYVNDIGGAGSGPVLFTQGATTSTLTYTFTSLSNTTDDLSFSNDGGVTWTAVPTFNVTTGCDTTVPAITHIRVNPKGAFIGSIGPNPSFQLTFRVCVQ